MHARTLWLAVIKQAIDDYRHPSPNPKLAWTRVDRGYFGSPDFIEVCANADVDPARVRGTIGL